MWEIILMMETLSEEFAAELVRLVLAGIDKEYPYKMGTVLGSAGDLKSPRQMHAVFNGHFDWHSSVHGHWSLVRLMRLFPEAAWAESVRGVLEVRLSQEGLASEARFLREQATFERMYGWAWLLKLSAEVRLLDNDWSERFAPLEQAVVENAMRYLPKLDWPVRCGFHPESSFAMSQMLDWARLAGHRELEELVMAKAIDFYAGDVDYPVRYEPSGNDFFSAGLNVADLMRRVYSSGLFTKWLQLYLPRLEHGDLGHWSEPVRVSDLGDGHLVHLVGLNLSRSWCLRGIADELELADPTKNLLLESAGRHLTAGLKGVHSGSYEGEHWLGSFVCYGMS